MTAREHLRRWMSGLGYEPSGQTRLYHYTP